MSGIWPFFAFIWWMTKLVRQMRSGIWLFTAFTWWMMSLVRLMSDIWLFIAFIRWMDWSDWWQASDYLLCSSGGWQNWSDYDDRHLILHCIHVVDDGLVRLMSGIWPFIAFIWWMTRPVKQMRWGIWLCIAFIWWMTDWSDWWWQASYHSLRSSGGWLTGQTDDDRHLIFHCVHLVDEGLVRLVMTGILSFTAFIWCMMRLVRLMMTCILSFIAFIWWMTD